MRFGCCPVPSRDLPRPRSQWPYLLKLGSQRRGSCFVRRAMRQSCFRRGPRSSRPPVDFLIEVHPSYTPSPAILADHGNNSGRPEGRDLTPVCGPRGVNCQASTAHTTAEIDHRQRAEPVNSEYFDPFGDHTTLAMRAPSRASCCCGAPPDRITKRSPSLRRPLANAMRRPSGDQDGDVSLAAFSVSCLRPPPAAN